MTTIYEWYGWPKKVAVNCSRCECIADLNNPKQVTKMVGPSTRPLKKEYTDFFTGHISCLNCGLSKEETMQWPIDAYYSGDVKGQILWAWNKAHAEAIREFVLSTSRNYKQYNYSASLYHLPEHFKLSKNRDACLKTLDRMISRKGK